MACKQGGIVLQSSEWGTSLGTYLLHMQGQGQLCDLDLIPSGQRPAITVHSCVMAACSTTLSSLVHGSSTRRLHLNTDPVTLHYIVTFCYVGKISIKQCELGAVHKASMEFNIKELQTLCQDILAREEGGQRDIQVCRSLDKNTAADPTKQHTGAEPATCKESEPLAAVNASLRFEPEISNAASMLPILSKIEGLDTFESSQELTFDVHFPGEPANSLSEPPKTRDNQATPAKKDTATNSFLCTDCGKVFNKLASLQMHEKRHKTTSAGATQFACKLCHKIFKTNQSLQVHTKKHTNEKSFQCAYCAKTFVRKTELTMHERVHTGERPYACKYCGKSFAQSTNLQDHERTHTGAKPFACDRCDATFSNGSNLLRHKKFHDRRLALGLPEQLRQKSEAMAILPSGEKIYPCKMCDKHFKRLRNLEDHQRTHTGEKPFKCSTCQRGFARQPNLIRHEKFHKKKQLKEERDGTLKPLTKSKPSTNDLSPAAEVINTITDFSTLNVQQSDEYQSAQHVFLATDTTSLATGSQQLLSSVPLLVPSASQSTSVVTQLENTVSSASSSVPATVSYSSVSQTLTSVSTADVFSHVTPPHSRVSSMIALSNLNAAVHELPPAVQGNTIFSYPVSSVLQATSQSDAVLAASVPHPGSMALFGNTPVSQINIGATNLSNFPTSVSTPTFPSSILSNTFPHSVSLLPHSISSVPHTFTSVPHFTPSVSSASSLVNSFSHSLTSVPHSVSLLSHSLNPVPQSSSSVLHSTFSVPNSGSLLSHSLNPVPHCSSSVLHSSSSVPHSSSAVSKPIAQSPIVSDPGLSPVTSFPDALGGYFCPGGFMAQLDAMPLTPTTLYSGVGEGGADQQ